MPAAAASAEALVDVQGAAATCLHVCHVQPLSLAAVLHFMQHCAMRTMSKCRGQPPPLHVTGHPCIWPASTNAWACSHQCMCQP